jgi:hypothetical protein
MADLDGGLDAAPVSSPNDRGPAYDPDTTFRVELAKPEAQKRALANVYEDFERLEAPLTAWKAAKGLHHTERVRFKEQTTTVLLNARVGDKTTPLAVASYPGKGRALWLFSDALWRLALTPSDATSRQTYNQFMHGAMTWLMRQDLRKPLVAKQLHLAHALRGGSSSFRAVLSGPAVRYFEPSADWRVTACGAAVPADKITLARHGEDDVEITGPLATRLSGGERCTLDVEGTHPAFGSVTAQIAAVFPETFTDDELDAAPQKLEDLARLTGATLVQPPKSPDAVVGEFLEQITGQEGVSLPSRYKTMRNFYWMLDRPWFWLLILLLPLEVAIRRADELFAWMPRARKG